MSRRSAARNGVRRWSESGIQMPVEIVGESPRFLEAVAMARKVAQTALPVLIVGETGTGKELLARYVHRESGRSGPLIDVDCGALPADLAESILFGHKRGAFTGALDDSPGLIALADGGSLLLDELGNLPLDGQAKLLRVLETGRVRRLGGSDLKEVGFRVIATAQHTLDEQVGSRDFRQDLLHRVGGVLIGLPALSARKDDISLLAAHFALELDLSVSGGAVDLLGEQEWPGNVRQLRWAVHRAGLFEAGGCIDRGAVTRALATGPRQLSGPPDGRRSEASASVLRTLCEHHSGDVDRIAAALDVSRSTVYRRIKKEGLRLREFRTGDAQDWSRPSHVV